MSLKIFIIEILSQAFAIVWRKASLSYKLDYFT